MLWTPANLGKPSSAVQQTIYDPQVGMVLPLSTGRVANPIYHHHMEATKLDIGGGVTRIFLSFSTHELAEDVVGQYVRYCYSDDNCATWSSIAALFPPPQAYTGQNYEAGGLRLQNSGFITVNGTLYALAQCLKYPRNNDRNMVGMLVREVNSSGLGSIYLVGEMGERELPYTAHPDSGDIFAEMSIPHKLPQCCKDLYGLKDYWDDNAQSAMRLVEPASILLNNGDTRRLWRGTGGSYGATASVWHETRVDSTTGIETYIGPTPIPNDPSRGVLLRLSDGRIAFAGNFIHNNNRKVIQLAVSNDECDSWYRLHDVWTNNGITPTYADATKGQDWRGGGQQYAALLEHAGKLHTFCSLKKEWVIRNTVDISQV